MSHSAKSQEGSVALAGELIEGVDLEVPMRGLFDSRPSREDDDDKTS